MDGACVLRLLAVCVLMVSVEPNHAEFPPPPPRPPPPPPHIHARYLHAGGVERLLAQKLFDLKDGGEERCRRGLRVRPIGSDVVESEGDEKEGGVVVRVYLNGESTGGVEVTVNYHPPYTSLEKEVESLWECARTFAVVASEGMGVRLGEWGWEGRLRC